MSHENDAFHTTLRREGRSQDKILWKVAGMNVDGHFIERIRSGRTNFSTSQPFRFLWST